jgi:hypothetical protein
MRLTNALVLVLTFVLGLFAFFSSYIALHHQQYEDNAHSNSGNPTGGNHVGEGDARHHALQFSRGVVGGFNLTKIKAAARDEISYLQAGVKEAVLHVTSGITTSSSIREEGTKEGIKTSTSTTVKSHKTSPHAIKEAYLSRMANRTGHTLCLLLLSSIVPISSQPHIIEYFPSILSCRTSKSS